MKDKLKQALSLREYAQREFKASKGNVYEFCLRMMQSLAKESPYVVSPIKLTNFIKDYGLRAFNSISNEYFSPLDTVIAMAKEIDEDKVNKVYCICGLKMSEDSVAYCKEATGNKCIH